MGPFLLLAALSFTDGSVSPQPVDEIVDVIELHQCFDFRGKLAFRQLIFYRWSGYHRRFQVVDTKVVTAESMVPRKSRSGFYRSTWKDNGQKRTVRALTFRQSKSSSDPEVPEREYVPIHLRKGLKQTTLKPIVNEEPTLRTSARLKPEKLLKF